MREVKPTQKPVPSSDIKDLFFNSGLLDIWATSLERKYIDRFGNCHLTAAGMEWIFIELVEKFKVDMNTAIVAAGYITIDSFQQGADLPNNELTQRNHILRDETTGEYYRWDGDLPKKVPAGSTPQSTGGIGKGAWVSVGDASLRSDIKSGDGSLIGVVGGTLADISIFATIPLSQCDGVIDNTAVLQSLLDLGFTVKVSNKHHLKITNELVFSTNGCGLVGEKGTKVTFENSLLQNPIWCAVKGTDVEIGGLSLDFSNGNCYAGIRTYRGAKRFNAHDIIFSNVMGSNSLNNQSVNCFWLETLDCEGFTINNIHFEGIKCLGNGIEGDSAGSITGILLRQYEDVGLGGFIDNITASDIYNVNSAGERIIEDADLIKSVGFKYAPVHVGKIIARNVGKRIIKNQAKGMSVDSIIYEHSDDLPIRAVVDHQDSHNAVNWCFATGNIASIYRSTSPSSTEQLQGCSFNGSCNTTYISTDNPASAIGVIDISSGKYLSMNAVVNGGLLGFRITTSDNKGVSESTFNLNINSHYAAVIRNVSNNGSIIDNIKINGTLTGTSNDEAPSLNIFTTNNGKIGTVQLNGKSSSHGNYGAGARVQGINRLILNSAEFDSPNSTSIEITNTKDVQIQNLSEVNASKNTALLRLQNVASGFVNGVTGGKPTGTSIGMVAVYGCSNMIFSSVNNLSSGQSITFSDNNDVSCTGCRVDSSTKKVIAPAAYSDSNLEWDGAPAFGPESSRVNYVKRGFIYRNTTTNNTALWTGFNWVGL
ncbi:TPA: hypothetical protein ACRR2I_002968 [Providencia rettgeri]